MFCSLEQRQRPPLSLCCSPRPSTHQTSLAPPPPPALGDAAAAATAAAPASPPPTPPDPVPPPPTPPTPPPPAAAALQIIPPMIITIATKNQDWGKDGLEKRKYRVWQRPAMKCFCHTLPNRASHNVTQHLAMAYYFCWQDLYKQFTVQDSVSLSPSSCSRCLPEFDHCAQ